jgi:hypothetical protein
MTLLITGYRQINSVAMSNPRQFLRFREAVLREFRFLDSHGLRVSEANESYVRYSSPKVDVEIFHGRQSFEIGLCVFRDGVKYSIGELLQLRPSLVTDPQLTHGFAATDAHAVEVGVARIASAFKLFSDAVLSDRSTFYEELDQQRMQNKHELALDSLAGQVRPMADEAFHTKDYRRAADLYEQIKERLSPSELRRLQIARSRS